MFSMYYTIYLILTLLVFYLLAKICWRFWIQSYGLLTIATPPTIPFFGNSLQFHSDPVKFNKQICEWSRVYGNLFCVWLGLKPIILSSSTKFLETILTSQQVITKSSIYGFFHDWLKTGLLTSTGTKWRSRRRLLTPSFHFSILNSFLKIFEEQAARLVENLRISAESGEVIDVQVPISLATLDIICETSMGVKINAQSCPDSDYVKAISTLNREIMERSKYPWLWPDVIYKRLPCGKRFYKALDVAHKMTLKVINQRIKIRSLDAEDESPSTEKKFFLDILLDIYKRGEIDAEGIQEEVDTFMFEGHDTTSAALSWTLWLLGSNPHVQMKLHTEINQVEESGGSLYEKVRSFKYLECVIKESLRMHPPVPIFAREIEENMIIDGQYIPKGSEVEVFVMMVHHNPEYWEDPYTFIPERFENDELAKRNPYSYIPFSAGPRNCIGQKFAMIEEKMLLYSIMKAFRVESMQKEGEIQGCIDLIHKSANGIMMKFSER